jgi:hypothetical protein
MGVHEKGDAERAIQEIAIISAIMIRLAKSAVVLGEKIEGPELMWLAEKLDHAVEMLNTRI